MMQELLLFGQVPVENHGTLREQLAGVTRMPPQVAVERHLIFKPIPPPGLANLPTGSGQPGTPPQEMQKTRQLLNAPLSYVQLVGILEQDEVDPSSDKRQAALRNGPEYHEVPMADDGEGSGEAQRAVLQWYLEWRDIPEPVKAPTTSRAISRTRIMDGDPIQFVKDLGFE